MQKYINKRGDNLDQVDFTKSITHSFEQGDDNSIRFSLSHRIDRIGETSQGNHRSNVKWIILMCEMQQSTRFNIVCQKLISTSTSHHVLRIKMCSISLTMKIATYFRLLVHFKPRTHFLSLKASTKPKTHFLSLTPSIKLKVDSLQITANKQASINYIKRMKWTIAKWRILDRVSNVRTQSSRKELRSWWEDLKSPAKAYEKICHKDASKKSCLLLIVLAHARCNDNNS